MVLVLRLFIASLIFQVSLTGVETDSFWKFCIVPVQVWDADVLPVPREDGSNAHAHPRSASSLSP